MTELRNRLRQVGVEYRVVKNTLARFAAEQAGKDGLIGIMEGPTAIAFGYDDIVQPAKALSDYVRTSRTPLTIRGALLDRRVLSAEEVQALSALPAREVLVTNLLGAMQKPIVGLVRVLKANLQGLVVLLQARIQKMGGE
jgi:large subunit ribosomal protein L10